MIEYLIHITADVEYIKNHFNIEMHPWHYFPRTNGLRIAVLNATVNRIKESA